MYIEPEMNKLVILISFLVLCDAQVYVNTEYGQVEGHTVFDVFNGEYAADVNSFLGVPYGKSTAGPLRFAKPEKPDPWGLYVASQAGESCPQYTGGLFDLTNPGWDKFGEDCLNLNIYTPTSGDQHPVMVWFHGGAYTGGANVQYPGHFLATRNVVVVIANYRLNHFGFAFTNSSACPGNFGLWDQNLALQFVRDNIAEFGGDPSRVTIFGQSAGASSSSLQMVSPASQGLMHQAVLESGTESSFWSVNWPESNPESYIWQVAANLNCSEDRDDFEMIDCLRGLPWETVREARFDCTPGHFCQGMGPVVDGPGGFLPMKPQELRESGNFMQGPIISGITKDDGSFYTLSLIPESLFGGYNRSEFQNLLRERIVSIWAPMMDDETAEDVFQAIDFNYSPWPHVEDEASNREAFNQIITDAAFGAPWDTQLKNHYTFAPTYGYVYDYRAIRLFPEWMGVPHMGELIAVWGYSLLPDNPAVKNDSGIQLDRLLNFTQEDVAHTVYWQTMYSNFAHTGNPTPEPVEDPLGGFTDWTTFDEDDMSFLYVYNETVQVQTVWEQKDYAFWREYVQWMTREYPFPIEGKGLPSNWLEDAVNTIYELMAEESVLLLDN